MIRTSIRILAFWVFIFFLHRLLLAVFLTPVGFPEGFSWWKILARGARFDLMVASWLCVPPLVAFLIPLLLGWPGRWGRGLLVRIYLMLMSLAVGIVTFIDFAGFHQTGDRWNQRTNALEILNTKTWSWPLLAAELGLVFLVTYQIRRWAKVNLEFAEVTLFRWILCAMLLVIGARGSIGPQHLDLRFAEISPSVVVQRVVVPSSYAFDQALRERR